MNLFEVGGAELLHGDRDLVSLPTPARHDSTYCLLRCPCGGIIRQTSEPRIRVDCIQGCADLVPWIEALDANRQLQEEARQQLADATSNILSIQEQMKVWLT